MFQQLLISGAPTHTSRHTSLNTHSHPPSQAEFFDTFQQLLISADAGSFEAYLRLIRAFGAQLHVEVYLAYSTRFDLILF